MFACFHSNGTIHISNLEKTEGCIPQILSIMGAPMGHLNIKFTSISFNSLGLLINGSIMFNSFFNFQKQ